MSVRLRKWKSRSGKVLEAWWIDVKFQHADGRIERVYGFLDRVPSQ